MHFKASEGSGQLHWQRGKTRRAMAVKSTTYINPPPLWVSCLQGNISWVVASLARGVNPNTSSPGGVPGLMYASSRGHNDVLEVFSDCLFKEKQDHKRKYRIGYDWNYFWKAQIKPIKVFFFHFPFQVLLIKLAGDEHNDGLICRCCYNMPSLTSPALTLPKWWALASTGLAMVTMGRGLAGRINGHFNWTDLVKQL